MLIVLICLFLQSINLETLFLRFGVTLNNYTGAIDLIIKLLLRLGQIVAGLICIGLIADNRNKLNEYSLASYLRTLIYAATCAYLMIGFYLAIKNFDLGYDEVWYIYYAKRFFLSVSNLFKGEVYNSFPTRTMLPHNLASLILYGFHLHEVWHFKLMNSVLTLVSMAGMYAVVRKAADKQTAGYFVLISIFWSTFLFVASSYFGVLIAVCLIFLGVRNYYKKGISWNALKAAIFFSLAMHTKIQLVPLLLFSILLLYAIERKKEHFFLFIYTIISYLLLVFIRNIPNMFITSGNILKSYVKLGSSFIYSRSGTYNFDHIQLFDNIIPIVVFLCISLLFIRKRRTGFDLFIYLISTVNCIWWMVFYNMATFRHLFLGLIPFAYITAKTISELNTEFAQKREGKGFLQSPLVLIGVLFLLINAGYMNLTGAYIGYNDGVQFQYSGAKSRLFKSVVTDTSQKDFYNYATQVIGIDDVIYNGNPFYTDFYLGIKAESYKEIRQEAEKKQWLIICREDYPLGLEQAYKDIKNMPGDKMLVFKTGDYELYRLNFEEEIEEE